MWDKETPIDLDATRHSSPLLLNTSIRIFKVHHSCYLIPKGCSQHSLWNSMSQNWDFLCANLPSSGTTVRVTELPASLMSWTMSLCDSSMMDWPLTAEIRSPTFIWPIRSVGLPSMIRPILWGITRTQKDRQMTMAALIHYTAFQYFLSPAGVSLVKQRQSALKVVCAVWACGLESNFIPVNQLRKWLGKFKEVHFIRDWPQIWIAN